MKRKNLAHFAKHPNFQLIEDNILSLDWRSLLANTEVIYHQAAQAGVRASWGEGFRHYADRNINATQVLLEAAKNAPQLKRFVLSCQTSKLH